MKLNEVIFPKIKEVPALWREDIGCPVHPSPKHKMLVNTDNGLVYGCASKDYKVTLHEDSIGRVLDACNKAGFPEPDTDVFFYQEGRKMEARFTFPWDFDVSNKKVGDIINPMAILRNSYDFVWQLYLSFFAKRLACLNGMTTSKEFFHYEKKHTNQIDMDQLNNTITKGLINFGDQIEVWKHWETRITQVNEYENVMGVLDLCNRDQEILADTVEVSSGVMLDDIKVRSLTYWAFFMILTQFITHKVASGLRRADLNNKLSRVMYH